MFAFISAWNEFFFALVIIQDPALQTAPLLLARYVGAEGSVNLGPLAATALVTTLPSLDRLRHHPAKARLGDVVRVRQGLRLHTTRQPPPPRTLVHPRKDHPVNRRPAVLAFASIAAVLVTAGCVSGGGGSSDSQSSAAPGEKVNLTFSSYAFQGPTVKATQEIVDSWNAAHPNVHVDYQKVDPNSVHDKLVTQFAGNSAPDIIHDESADIAGFSRQGYLADLGPLLPADLKSDVPESVWKSVTVDGKVAGVPTIAQVYNLFADTDALKAAGSTRPPLTPPGPGTTSRPTPRS